MIDLEVTEERLRKKDITLTAAPVLTGLGEKYQADQRKWQGIPSIEISPGGRLWAAFYTGGADEGKDNFVLLKKSDDYGKTWSDPIAAVDPPDEVRAFDQCLWFDPDGRLWLFWAQSLGGFDGRAGVFGVFCQDHEDKAEQWSAPVRIGDGVMLNKPIVCSDGEWLFPVALWKRFPSAFNPDQPRALSNVYSSSDHGKTFQYKGGIAIPGRYYDESVLVEKKNGLLWMLVRCEDGVGQAFSKDGGKTWENPGKSDIPGPNSRFQVMRLRSGNLLMVNHQPENGLYRPNPDEEFFYIRSQLTAYLSCDDGKTWSKQLLLDERDGVSYPDVAQDDNGDIYIIYDYNRYKDMEILMAVIRETEDNGLEAKQLKVVVDKPH